MARVWCSGGGGLNVLWVARQICIEPLDTVDNRRLFHM